MLRGQTQYNRHSRFIDEIPSAYLDIKKNNSTHQEVKKIDCPVKYQYGAGAGKPYNPVSYTHLRYVPNVVMTVVDVIGAEEVAACQKVCDTHGLQLRVRPYEAN